MASMTLHFLVAQLEKAFAFAILAFDFRLGGFLHHICPLASSRMPMRFCAPSGMSGT
jgi:hypothetical protein